jgi:RNA polymerase sigma factor (sigma-70 family)
VRELSTPTLDSSEILKQLLCRCATGDDVAREELIAHCSARFQTLTRSIMRGYPGVGRWEQTDDVCQQATLKIWEELKLRPFESELHFFRSSARIIRHILIDLSRSYAGPQGLGRNHATFPSVSDRAAAGQAVIEATCETYDPQMLAQWSELHTTIESLSPASVEMFDLIYYHEFSQAAVGKLLGLSERHVRRRWGKARDELAASLDRDGLQT